MVLNRIVVQMGHFSQLLKTSYIGYHNNYKNITVHNNFNADTIILKHDIENLEEVTLSFQKPRLEKKNGRLIFQVENSTLSSLSTYEILQRTPGVISLDDKISVKNRVPCNAPNFTPYIAKRPKISVL